VKPRASESAAQSGALRGESGNLAAAVTDLVYYVKGAPALGTEPAPVEQFEEAPESVIPATVVRAKVRRAA